MKHLKTKKVFEAKASFLTKEKYDIMVEDITYILQDIVDDGFSLDIPSYDESCSPGYMSGRLADLGQFLISSYN